MRVTTTRTSAVGHTTSSRPGFPNASESRVPPGRSTSVVVGHVAGAHRAGTTLVRGGVGLGMPLSGSSLAPIDAERDRVLRPRCRSCTNHGLRSTTCAASSPTTEVFVNGQAAGTNQPRAIARSFVNVAPQPHAPMDFFANFAPSHSTETLHPGSCGAPATATAIRRSASNRPRSTSSSRFCGRYRPRRRNGVGVRSGKS